MPKRIVMVLCILVCCNGILAQEFQGARPVGLGQAFVGVADDVNAAIWNPAGLGFLTTHEVTGTFSRLYLGIGNDNVGQGQFAYAHLFDFGTVGIAWQTLFSDIYSDHQFTLSYARKLGLFAPSTGWEFGAGINLKALTVGYNRDAFENNPDEAQAVANSTIFADGYRRWAFGADLGLRATWRNRLTFGLFAYQVNQPNLALVEVPKGKFPFELRLGSSYLYNDWLLAALDLHLLNEKVGPGSTGNMAKVHFGLEAWFWQRTVAFRTGVNPDEYALGFSYRTRQFVDFQFDYAFVYPLSDIFQVGATSHRVSATVRILKPEPEYEFLVASVRSDRAHYAKGDTVKVRSVLLNYSDLASDNVGVTFYTEDSSGQLVLVARQTVAHWVPQSPETLNWTWIPPKEDRYKLLVSVDDDGAALPALHGAVGETNEENNTGWYPVKTYPLPRCGIHPKYLVLKISGLYVDKEEEPLIPVVFFDPVSAAYDPRFDHLLSVIAQRLADNPDVTLHLKGYISSESDGAKAESLAALRAQTVRAQLDRLAPGVGAKCVLDPVSGYDVNSPRSSRSWRHQPQDVPRAEAENRRVELYVTFPAGQAEIVESVPFDRNVATTSWSPDSDISQWTGLLRRNPELVVLNKGYYLEGETGGADLGFARAQAVRERVLPQIDAELRDRVYIRAEERPGSSSRADVMLIGDGVLFKPVEVTVVPEITKMENEENLFTMGYEIDEGLKVLSHRAWLTDLAGRQVLTLSEGSGAPPATEDWRWRDAAGQLVDAEHRYQAHLEIVDELGNKAVANSETLSVVIDKQRLKLEQLFLDLFTFDESRSVSRYLECRREVAARRLVAKSLQEQKPSRIVIGGHTDVIGLARRNKTLSQERADTELRQIRRYLKLMVGSADDAALDDWFKGHGVVIEPVGFGADKPFEMTFLSGEGMRKKNLGDNAKPEGRNINRRVLIEFEY